LFREAVVARESGTTAVDDGVREGIVVLVGDAHRAGNSVLLTCRGPDDRRFGDGAWTEPDSVDQERDLPRGLSKFHAPEIVFGDRSLTEAAHAAAATRCPTPADGDRPGARRGRLPAELLAGLRDAGLRPEVWMDVTPNPRT
jgi:alcohol dehydrogenase